MSDEALFQKRMAKTVRKKKEPKIDIRSEAEKEIDTAVAETKLQEQEKLRKKRNFRRTLGGAGALIFAYLIYLGLKPFEAGMGYAVCKVFVELNVRYPDTLYFSSVETFGSSIRVWYTHVDAFGEYKLESTQCFYKPDPENKVPFIFERVAINRRDVDSEKIDHWNKILPVTFAHHPTLVYPTALPDSLGALKFDTDRYRKNLGLR
jgi:hypothetical protein